VAVVLVGICVGSNLYHKDSLERVGLANRNFIPNLKRILPIALPLVIILIGPAWGKEFKGGWDVWFVLLGYPFWGFAQEYALLGFVANRLEDGLPNHGKMVPWLNGFLLSLAHAPNPMLMGVTFVSGTLFTHVFFKSRHLVPLAFVHALFGVGLSLAFGHIEGSMSVGPAYLSRM